MDLFTKTGLAPGNHTIKVENVDADKLMLVDKFEVLRSPVLVNDDSPIFTYSGSGWTDQNGRSSFENGLCDYKDDAHFTTANDSYVTISFTGLAVDIISEKHPVYGDIDVYLDDVFEKTISHYNDGSRLVQQRLGTFIFDTYGDHTIKLVKKSGQYMIIDAVKVYSYYPF